MKTAFFLGAGASNTFGYPMTSHVLPLILQRLLQDTLFTSFGPSQDTHGFDRERFRTVLTRFVPGWKQAYDAANKDLDAGTLPRPIGVGVTDVLTLVDHVLATADGKGSEGPSVLATFRELLERAIYEVLQPSNVHVATELRQNQAKFSRWILANETNGGVSVVTTNYDLTADQTWFAVQTEARKADPALYRPDPLQTLDLGFERRDVASGAVVPRAERATARLLKLHGSLNWLRCPVCGHTYVNPAGDIGWLAFVDDINEWNTCHCNPWARLRLPLVAPSLARTVGDRNLASIWRVAFESLYAADAWYVIGYSMPSEDVAIRTMLCRAAGARTKPPSIIVIQRGGDAEPLYRSLFPSCEYHPEGLAAYLAKRHS